jgi:hypothetical protein
MPTTENTAHHTDLPEAALAELNGGHGAASGSDALGRALQSWWTRTESRPTTGTPANGSSSAPLR